MLALIVSLSVAVVCLGVRLAEEAEVPLRDLTAVAADGLLTAELSSAELAVAVDARE